MINKGTQCLQCMQDAVKAQYSLYYNNEYWHTKVSTEASGVLLFDWLQWSINAYYVCSNRKMLSGNKDITLPNLILWTTVLDTMPNPGNSSFSHSCADFAFDSAEDGMRNSLKQFVSRTQVVPLMRRHLMVILPQMGFKPWPNSIQSKWSNNNWATEVVQQVGIMLYSNTWMQGRI